ncbi:MAG TPA: PQQ-binding-like beta-propeller repeat protein [Candidatus Bathyarchaeia archaeon]|nr:PQQ-binding-like beta-propeller repeat protein [Candidatus Bathyarchaeia archaeon]
MRSACIVLLLSVLSLAFVVHETSPTTTARPILAAGLGVTDYPWAMFHNNAARTGATLASAPVVPNLQWTYPTGSLVYPSPAVADGTVFISSYDGNLYAIDEFSGTLKWTFPTSAPVYASPAVANGRVFVVSRDSWLYALDEATGSTLWSRQNPTPITSSPAVADGIIFYGTWYRPPGSLLMAVNATTGGLVWQYYSDDTIRSSPSVLGGRVFFGQDNGYVIALNETTHALLWRVQAGAAIVGTAPALANGRVYVGMDSSQFLALDQVTGALRWSYPIGPVNATSGAVANGVVYFGTGAGIVYALNATTGGLVWQYPSSGSIGAVSSSPAISLGSRSILFGSSDHYLYSLNMTNGALLWKYLSGSSISSSPAVADNRVFFGSWDSKVYSLGTRLQVTVSANPTSLRPGAVSVLSMTVTNGTVLQSSVALTFSSSAGGSFTAPVMTGPGVYMSNYTAPVVTSQTTTTVQVVASKSGYASGVGQMTITLQPPTLTVSVVVQPASVSPGSDTIVKIGITNGTRGVAGAAIVLSSTAGGSFSGLADSGNGNYTAVFNAPLLTSNPTVTVRASKAGYTSGVGSATVSVAGLPNPVSLKIIGIPFLAILAAALLVIFFMFFLVFRRKANGPKSGPKPVVAPPVYAAGRARFSRRLI